FNDSPMDSQIFGVTETYWGGRLTKRTYHSETLTAAETYLQSGAYVQVRSVLRTNKAYLRCGLLMNLYITYLKGTP
ncbi:hypothetical protein BD311DRAFT_755321, partial [Dichomitus squalens]